MKVATYMTNCSVRIHQRMLNVQTMFTREPELKLVRLLFLNVFQEFTIDILTRFKRKVFMMRLTSFRHQLQTFKGQLLIFSFDPVLWSTLLKYGSMQTLYFIMIVLLNFNWWWFTYKPFKRMMAYRHKLFVYHDIWSNILIWWWVFNSTNIHQTYIQYIIKGLLWQLYFS